MNTKFYYDQKRRHYILIFENNTIEMRLCEFVSLHKYLKSFNIADLLEDMTDAADKHCFKFEKNNLSLILDLHQLISLQNIIDQGMFDMKLEDLLFRLNISCSVINIESNTLIEVL